MEKSSTLFRAGDITHIAGVNSGDRVVHVGGDTDSQLTIPVVLAK